MEGITIVKVIRPGAMVALRLAPGHVHVLERMVQERTRIDAVISQFHDVSLINWTLLLPHASISVA